MSENNEKLAEILDRIDNAIWEDKDPGDVCEGIFARESELGIYPDCYLTGFPCKYRRLQKHAIYQHEPVLVCLYNQLKGGKKDD